VSKILGSARRGLSSVSASPVASIPAERWGVVRALLRDDHAALDPQLPKLVHMLDERGAGECWHKHGTFKEHLVDTHNVLRLWGQPTFLCRLGLFHSAYSNSYVNLAIFDASADRQLVAGAIGAEAEALTHKLCVVPRHTMVWDTLAEEGKIPAEGMTVAHIKTGEEVHLSAAELRHLLVFTMADIAEQYAGWYDEVFDYPRSGAIFAKGAATSTVGHEPAALWPGACRPGLWVSHVGRLACAVASLPPSVDLGGAPLPPVFQNCSDSNWLTPENELRARDLYVSVTNQALGGPSPSNARADATAKLREAHRLNPHVGEPLTVLAQCLLADGDFEGGEAAAASALELHCAWGTSWDKRMRWAGWLAWTRVLLGRAREREPWPSSAWAAVNLGLVR